MAHFLLQLVGWQMLHALFPHASQDSRYCLQVIISCGWAYSTLSSVIFLRNQQDIKEGVLVLFLVFHYILDPVVLVLLVNELVESL